MNRVQRSIPWIVAALALAYLAAGLLPARSAGPMDWAAFGRIPVTAEGRTKPLDTFARNTLMVMSSYLGSPSLRPRFR